VTSAKEDRNILDDITDGVRQVLDEIDRLINPEKRPKPVPVPVPVRIRSDRRLPDDRYQ
jgi:hypothetical protein